MNGRLTVTILTVLAALGCATSTPNLETYRAQAVVMGAIATGANSTLQLSITRWTTDEESAALFASLREGGSGALRKALFESEETGFVTIPGSASIRLRYARATEKNGERTIVLATDRRLTFAEGASGGRRSRDYDVSIIVLKVDQMGSGEGTWSVGTNVTYVEETGHLVLENYSTEPVRLLKVSRIE